MSDLPAVAYLAAASIGKEWPRFQSHRVIQALPIITITEAAGEDTVRVLFVDPTGTGTSEPFLTTVAAMVDKASVGDYAMRYPDGFQSVCPKAAFEDGYSPLTVTNPAEPLMPVGSGQLRPSIAELEAMIAGGAKIHLNPDGTVTPLTHVPQLGVMVHDLDDAVCGIHAIEPDGTEHSITMPANHGALIAFKAAVIDWIDRLGTRATAWEKTSSRVVEEERAKILESGIATREQMADEFFNTQELLDLGWAYDASTGHWLAPGRAASQSEPPADNPSGEHPDGG